VNGPVRTCAGCGERASSADLIRFILTPDNGVVPDLAGSSFGRGAWVHPRVKCIDAAAARGFSKSYKCHVKAEGAQVRQTLAAAAERRLSGLLTAAQRSGHLLYGAQAIQDALRLKEERFKSTPRQVELLLLARDARAAAAEGFVAELVARGKVTIWGTKAELGERLGRGDVALVALCDAGIGRAVSFAISLVLLAQDTSLPQAEVASSGQLKHFPEVR
jgi:hypothetical protein